jgi:hypothetical protein
VVGGDVSAWEPARVIDAVRLRVAAASVDLGEEVAFKLEALAEGLVLRSALADLRAVDHGFAGDGSITITFGPELPDLEILGIRGSLGDEMMEEPDRVFGVAAQLTGDAARVVALLERAVEGRPDVWEREVQARVDSAAAAGSDDVSAVGGDVPAVKAVAEGVDRVGPGRDDSDLAPYTYMCVFCSTRRTLMLPAPGLERWRAGASLSEAFPSLAAGAREALGSGICPDCQDEVFDG